MDPVDVKKAIIDKSEAEPLYNEPVTYQPSTRQPNKSELSNVT